MLFLAVGLIGGFTSLLILLIWGIDEGKFIWQAFASLLVCIGMVVFSCLMTDFTYEKHTILTNEWENIKFDRVVKVEYEYRLAPWYSAYLGGNEKKRNVKITNGDFKINPEDGKFVMEVKE